MNLSINEGSDFKLDFEEVPAPKKPRFTIAVRSLEEAHKLSRRYRLIGIRVVLAVNPKTGQTYAN